MNRKVKMQSSSGNEENEHCQMVSTTRAIVDEKTYTTDTQNSGLPTYSEPAQALTSLKVLNVNVGGVGCDPGTSTLVEENVQNAAGPDSTTIGIS
jgi:hypothetical protein